MRACLLGLANGFLVQMINPVSPKRVLVILPNLDNGGTEGVLMNYLRFIDTTVLVFDFLVHEETGYHEAEAFSLGSAIYRVPTRRQDRKGNVSGMKNIYAENDYDTVIVCTEHSLAFIDLYVAKKSGVRNRIVWSHFSDYQGKSRLRKYLHYIFKPLLKRYATQRWACSDKAGKWMYGRQYEIINNGIDCNKFAYNPNAKQNSSSVIGHIGRFTAVKNHAFILDVFRLVAEAIPNVELLLVGDGELFDEIKEKADGNERIIFTGAVHNPQDYYNKMDVLVLPSFHEGMPLCALEAQMSNCPCVLTDTITKSVNVTDNVTFLPLQKDLWAKTIIEILNNKTERKTQRELFEEKGFDISNEAKKMEVRLCRL
jgi:glycosyltransferase involved in cell wall biosynthesis